MLNAAKSSHKLSNPGKSFSTFFLKTHKMLKKILQNMTIDYILTFCTSKTIHFHILKNSL